MEMLTEGWKFKSGCSGGRSENEMVPLGGINMDGVARSGGMRFLSPCWGTLTPGRIGLVREAEVQLRRAKGAGRRKVPKSESLLL